MGSEMCIRDSYINQHFADYKGDLFSVFMFRNFAFCKKNGYSGFMTPMVWMFIKTYEELRKYIISQKSISTLIQFEYSAFEEATVPICSFVLKNGKPTENALCFRLSTFTGGMDVQKQKVLEALDDKDCGYFHEADQSNFSKIPGSPIAYWWKNDVYELFEGKLLGDFAQPKVGLQTGENEKYLRFWNEVCWQDVALGCINAKEALKTQLKWFPCNKGGEFRRWYGNNNIVVDWENDGERIRRQKGSYIRNPQYYFKKGFSWSTISSSKISMRYSPAGFLFETKGSVCFPNKKEDFEYLFGLLNSCVAQWLLAALSPTLDYHEGPLSRIPTVINDGERANVRTLVEENVVLSQSDWDAFETSWDFKKNPLV